MIRQSDMDMFVDLFSEACLDHRDDLIHQRDEIFIEVTDERLILILFFFILQRVDFFQLVEICQLIAWLPTEANPFREDNDFLIRTSRTNDDIIIQYLDNVVHLFIHSLSTQSALTHLFKDIVFIITVFQTRKKPTYSSRL